MILKNIDPFIVLHHPDVNFKGELTGLLKDEVSLGRVDSNTFATIMWDLDGRQGIPDVKGVTFVIHKKDGTVDTIKN